MAVLDYPTFIVIRAQAVAKYITLVSYNHIRTSALVLQLCTSTNCAYSNMGRGSYRELAIELCK